MSMLSVNCCPFVRYGAGSNAKVANKWYLETERDVNGPLRLFFTWWQLTRSPQSNILNGIQTLTVSL